MRQSRASAESHHRAVIAGVYERLRAAYGPQGWWPAESPFEMIVGAILVQAVAWRNVEGTMAKLKAAGALSPAALRRIQATRAWVGTKLAIEYLILTACRSGEVRGARWDEIDPDRRLWTVPAAGSSCAT